MATLDNVKIALGITGTYQDATLQVWFDEVVALLVDSGIPAELLTDGIVTIGVDYLWNNGGDIGGLPAYLIPRATQLFYKAKKNRS